MRASRSHCFSSHMSNQHLCQSSPFTSKIGPNGLNWQCCLAGSSKTAPRILIFSIAMGARPSFQLKSIAILAPAFFMHKKSFIATVYGGLEFEVFKVIYYSHSGRFLNIFNQNFKKSIMDFENSEIFQI